MVKAQVARRKSADLQLVSNIAGAEHAGRERNERRQDDKDVIQIVNEQVTANRRPAEQKRHRRDQSYESSQHIEASSSPVTGQQRQHSRSNRGNDQHDS